MMEMMEKYADMVVRYFGSPAGCALVLGLILLIWIFRKKIPGAVPLLLYLLCLTMVLNPLSQKLLGGVMQEHLFWRFYWLIPVPILAGILVTGLAERLKGALKAVPLAALAVVLIFCGRNVYSDGAFTEADNPFKLPAEAVAVSAELLSRLEGDSARIVVPDDLFCYIRQYSSRLRLLYGRNIAGFTDPVTSRRIIHTHNRMNQPYYKLKRLAWFGNDLGVDYFVLYADRPKKGKTEENGFVYLTTVGNYELYRFIPGEEENDA